MDLLYEPRHLLGFEGDPDLQFCYRSLVTKLHKDGVKSGFGLCAACNAALTDEDHPRLKPLQRLTKTIQKLITKSSKKIPLNRFENFKLQKFLKSSQQMIVKCSHCDFINKKPILERENLISLKEKLMLTVENTDEEVLDEPVVEAPKKRKRKKKKKKKGTHSNPNSLISDEEEEKDEDTSTLFSTPKSSLMTPSTSHMTPSTSGRKDSVSLKNFVKSLTTVTSSSAIFQRAINDKTLKQTPVSYRPVGKSMNLAQSAKKKSSVHKQLKLFLCDKTPQAEKSANLKDFLTLL